jgi:hypothetical protein
MTEQDQLFVFWKSWVGLAIANGGVSFTEQIPEERVAQWVASYDLIMAVFPSHQSPMGVQLFPVKGGDVFSEGLIDNIRSNAIPCESEAVALALLKRLGGDPEWANCRWAAEETVRPS